MLFRSLSGNLGRSGHTIEIKSFDIYHRLCEVVFLFSFFEESPFIDDSHLDELIDILGWEFLFWECLFILEIANTPFERRIDSDLFIFISRINKG